ncbi:MAG: DUF4276 family protein [Planctomycetes bacterium]|nr:DUF4276 family protein [Planctomycetota bacterium]
MLQVACIVEGHGEVPAVPELVRRIARDLDPSLAIQIPPPLRIPRSKLVQTGEIERAVEFAARKTGGTGAVLVLLDSDDDCPAQLGPALLSRAKAARRDIPLAVVLAHREYEAWFLASAESLRGRRRLPADLSAPPAPESIRDTKGWLSNHMPGKLKYQETVDQAALTAIFDFTLARRCRSFDKCYRDITSLLSQLRESSTESHPS